MTSKEVHHGDGHTFGAELRKEGYTMSLYVAVALLAALMAVPDATGRHLQRSAGVAAVTA